MKSCICPFTILIDSAEQHPWTFSGMVSGADRGYKSIAVATKWVSLGRYPNGLGDYSIEGHEGIIHVERKSIEDLQGTVLGFPKQDEHGVVHGTARRDRFERELENLSKLRWSAIFVEGTFPELISTVKDYGTKTVETQQKILSGSILSYQQDFQNVQWVFAESRRSAEVLCFRYFQRYWKYQVKKKERTIARQLKEFADV